MLNKPNLLACSSYLEDVEWEESLVSQMWEMRFYPKCIKKEMESPTPTMAGQGKGERGEEIMRQPALEGSRPRNSSGIDYSTQ